VVKLKYETVIGTVYDNVVERVINISVNEPEEVPVGSRHINFGFEWYIFDDRYCHKLPDMQFGVSLDEHKQAMRRLLYHLCAYFNLWREIVSETRSYPEKQRLGGYICYNKQMRRVTCTLMRLHSPMVVIT
jgi:hypothetical protein